MSIPASYRPTTPNCGQCKHAKWIMVCDAQLWCFHGEVVKVTGQREYPVKCDIVELSDGRAIDDLRGNELDREWVRRVVDCAHVCDSFEEKNDG